MTAREVISQIQALPAEEKVLVMEFLEEVRSEHRAQTMKPEIFNEAAKRVFDRHTELMVRLSK